METILAIFWLILSLFMSLIKGLLPLAVVLFIIMCFIKGRKRNPHQNTSTNKINLTPNEYKTGWKWNESTQLWEPPGYQQKPQIKRDTTNPTYEEWKAQREAEKRKEAETTPQAEPQIIISYVPPKIYNTPTKPEPKPEPPKPARNPEYLNAYQAANILTWNESQNYKVLKAAADRKGYLICPKVRLADLVTPRNDAQYMSRFGKIKSKHVDFVICDQDMKVKAILELDDSSHDREDRKARDEFVDTILEDVGYKVIHTRYITADILDGV